MHQLVNHFRAVLYSVFLISSILFLSNCSDNKKENYSSDVDTIVYQSEAYSIYSHSVEDPIYGGKNEPALIPNDSSIYSAVRVIPKGLTKIIDSSNFWHPVPEISKFPSLHTKHASVNATYNLALDHLYRCSSGEFLRNKGEEGKWQAGYKYGVGYKPGSGYGVWIRDVCYTALWMGSFIDKDVAKKSIEYVTLSGIDNGEDGLPLPAIAVWNHFVITGDTSIIRNTYENLKSKIEKIKFDKDRNLEFAHAGSFVDSNPQPEAGGFPLSTNILYAESYLVMAHMGKLMNESTTKVKLWEERSAKMKETIRREFWNPKSGYYNLGPKGTESYQKEHWENLGQSLAIWPMWNIADKAKRNSVLDNKKAAYNSYGFTDLNYSRTPYYAWQKSLHGMQVWIFTEVGEMVAMAHEKRIDEVLELFSSVVRTAAMHKSFYECVDWETGAAWRYGGQLWHAMGYISMVQFGLLGMEYNEIGLTFSNACVPKPLADLELHNFQYRAAIFDIKVVGWGTFDKLILDGKPVDKINSSLKGKHQIEILLKQI